LESTGDCKTTAKHGCPRSPACEFARQTAIIVETYLRLRETMEGPEDQIRLRWDGDGRTATREHVG